MDMEMRDGGGLIAMGRNGESMVSGRMYSISDQLLLSIHSLGGEQLGGIPSDTIPLDALKYSPHYPPAVNVHIPRQK